MRVQRVATQGKAILESPPDPVLTCANPGCRATFTPVRKWQKFHSARSRFHAWNRLRTLREPTVVPPSGTKARLTIHCVVEWG